MERMSDRCYFPSWDPIYTKPRGTCPLHEGRPIYLAKASDDILSKVGKRVDRAHTAHGPKRLIFGSKHLDGP